MLFAHVLLLDEAGEDSGGCKILVKAQGVVVIPVGDITCPVHVVPVCTDGGVGCTVHSKRALPGEFRPLSCFALNGDHPGTAHWVLNPYFIK